MASKTFDELLNKNMSANDRQTFEKAKSIVSGGQNLENPDQMHKLPNDTPKDAYRTAAPTTTPPATTEPPQQRNNAFTQLGEAKPKDQLPSTPQKEQDKDR
jgi:hypothetical protein